MFKKIHEYTEKELTKLELETTVIFNISLLISLSLVYNSYLKFSKKNFYTNKEAYYIGVFNRILVTILSFSYLYINIKNKQIIKNNKENLFNLQIGASTLSLIAALIVLYVVINNNDYNIVGIENPSI